MISASSDDGTSCCGHGDEEEDVQLYAPLSISGNIKDDNDSDEHMRCPRRYVFSRARGNPAIYVTATILIGICTYYIITSKQTQNINILRRFSKRKFGMNKGANQRLHHYTPTLKKVVQRLYPPFPAGELLGISVVKATTTTNINDNVHNKQTSIDPPYDPSDFQYQNAGKTRILTYWEEVVAAIEKSQEPNNSRRRRSSKEGNGDTSLHRMELSRNEPASIISPWTNLSSWGPCFPRELPWTYTVQSNSYDANNETIIEYPKYRYSFHQTEEEYLGGLCRPGFLIIGQGKCGTSSLYHYLTGHDRILPAVTKQIHYFLYHTNKSLKWYYSNFPTIESYLGTGTLMTGEASPGYMPYPSVIRLLVQRMSATTQPKKSTDGLEAYRDSVQSLPKIIAVVRDPIERAVSSYKYNYVTPALNVLKRGLGVTALGEPIPARKSEQFYKNNYLYTFEELASAELLTLKKCLQPGGKAERYTYENFGKSKGMFFYNTFLSRTNRSLAPLVHIDGYGACYESTKSQSVPQKQWMELARRNPNKTLDLPDLQLVQSIVGRGIYVLPLEWWYEVFASASEKKGDWIYTVCTEEMGDTPAKAIADVARFLGLPAFDFRNVTGIGRYNVDGHTGYDTASAVDEESDGNEELIETSPTNSSLTDLTSISDRLMSELMEFYRPYNERLFELIGKRCAWTE